MKFFVYCLALCALGISQAQSQDSPEVAAAKAAHFEAVRRAELVIANAPAPVNRSQQQPPVVETSQHKLGLNVQDTPEVAAAKTAHYEAVRDAEYATALANATNHVLDSKTSVPVHYPTQVHQPAQVQQPAPVNHQPIHYPAVHRPVAVHPSGADHYPAPIHQQHSATVIQTNQHQLGVNVHDTPEVAAAKAAHYEAVRLAQAAALSGLNDDGSYVMVQPALNVPVAPAVHGSVHLRDTPEVAAAKAAHFEALRRVQIAAEEQYVPMAHQVMYIPVAYQQNIDYNRMYPIVSVPQTNQHKLGVNVHDTPEVAAAKAAHFEAFRQAQLLAAKNEQEFPPGFIPNNSYYNNPARQYMA